MTVTHYARVVVLIPQMGMNSPFYASCGCGWNGPVYRSMERAWEDGKAHQEALGYARGES